MTADINAHNIRWIALRGTTVKAGPKDDVVGRIGALLTPIEESDGIGTETTAGPSPIAQALDAAEAL
jgi:hypothetical protein